MINNLRFELSFKDIVKLEEKLNFCKFNGINNINIPCKGHIKKQFYNKSFEYLKKNYHELNMVFHYSLYHQYSKNKENSYQEFLNFYQNCYSYNNFKILLISGSKKIKNYDVINVLNNLKNEKVLYNQLGIAYNPYLNKYFNSSLERERFEKKISTGLINSIWIQFGTDIKLLEKEFNFIQKYNNNFKFYGSLLIPSKQFIARFKFRPWSGVHIANEYLDSLDNFYSYTKELIKFYLDNNIIPVIETDFSSSTKVELIYSLFN
tara:strand:+ start:642 stop:1430 length:789 start_codon:yes stop_codon:yes gene_type:complete